MAWQLSQGDGKGSMRYRFIQMLCLFVCLLFQTVGKSLVDEIRFIQTFCLSLCCKHTFVMFWTPAGKVEHEGKIDEIQIHRDVLRLVLR